MFSEKKGEKNMKKTTAKIMNFRSEGHNMLFPTAVFEFITNSIDEVLDFCPNGCPSVSAGICDGESYSFLEDGAKYIMVADNGRGIDFDEFFQNGDPGAMRRNHHYHKGVVRAMSRLWPNDGGRIVIATKKAGEANWSCYDGSFFEGEVTVNEDLGLSKEFNSYVFIKIDEYENPLNELDDIEERLRTKYHYYLKNRATETFFLKWNGNELRPLTFVRASNDGYKSWCDDFGKFTLEIERFRAPRKKEKEPGKSASQPKYSGFDGSGGIAIYHDGLLIQDAQYLCIFKRSDANTIYQALNAVSCDKGLTKHETIAAFGADIAKSFMAPNVANLPNNGLEKNKGSMNGYRYLVNVKPKNGFVLDTDDTKTKFRWNNSLKTLFLAIDSVIGDEVREIKRKGLESATRAEIDKAFQIVKALIGENFDYKTEVNPASNSKLRLDGVWYQKGSDNPLGIIEYKAEELKTADSGQLMRYHARFCREHKDSFASVDGKIRTPDLCLVFNGEKIPDDVKYDLESYKEMISDNYDVTIKILRFTASPEDLNSGDFILEEVFVI